jgi:hypothetical protein
MIRIALLAVALALSASGAALADCVCRCVNGEAQAICSNALTIPPPCMQICPMAPLSITPIEPPTIPPIGTDNCRMQQVMNPRTGVYQWRQLCQ